MKLQKFIAIILILLLTFLSFQTSYAQVNNEALKFAIKQKAFEVAVGKSLIAGGLAVSSYNTMKEVVSDTITNMGDTAIEFRDSIIDNTTNTIKLWGVVGSTVWSGVKSVVSNFIDRLNLTQDSTVEYLPNDVVIESNFDANITGISVPTIVFFGAFSSTYIEGVYDGRKFYTNFKKNTYSVQNGTINFDPTQIGVKQYGTLSLKVISSGAIISQTVEITPNTGTLSDGRKFVKISIRVGNQGVDHSIVSTIYNGPDPREHIVPSYTLAGNVYSPSGTITAKAPAFNPSWDYENRNTKQREVAIPLPKEILSVNEGVKDTGLNLDNLTTKELETINNTLEKEYSELHTKTIEDLTVENALEGVPEFVGETTIDGISSIFDLLNPYSDTFILKLAFVPSVSLIDYYLRIKDLFFTTFPFIPQLFDTFDILIDMINPFSGYEGQPDDITIDLPAFAGGQTVTVLSFDLYSDYRDYIFMFIRVIAWAYFLKRTFNSLSFIFAKH